MATQGGTLRLGRTLIGMACEPVDRRRSCTHDELHDLALGQSATDLHRVGDVLGKGIRTIENRGDTALGVERVRLLAVALDQERDLRPRLRGCKRGGGAARTTADDEEVEAIVRNPAGVDGEKTAVEVESVVVAQYDSGF